MTKTTIEEITEKCERENISTLSAEALERIAAIESACYFQPPLWPGVRRIGAMAT